MIDIVGTSLLKDGDPNLPIEISELQSDGPLRFFILAVIIIPILETIFFQAFIIHLSKLILRKLNVLIPLAPIIISAVSFGLVHSYNEAYLILRSVGGVFLAFAYVIGHKRKETGVVLVSMIHSILNLIPFLRDFYNEIHSTPGF
jgi:membrane protease YdiL (CAAX protease family)